VSTENVSRLLRPSLEVAQRAKLLVAVGADRGVGLGRLRVGHPSPRCGLGRRRGGDVLVQEALQIAKLGGALAVEILLLAGISREVEVAVAHAIARRLANQLARADSN
jgi:hypothetical protein